MQLKTRISDSVVKKDLPLMAATENSFKMTNCNNISTKNNKKMYSWKKEKISQEAIIKYDATAQEYQCKACTYRSNQKGNIWTHFKSIHLRDRPYMCDLCPLSFVQPKDQLRDSHQERTSQIKAIKVQGMHLRSNTKRKPADS